MGKEANIEGTGSYNQEDVSGQSSFGNDRKKQEFEESPKRRVHFTAAQKADGVVESPSTASGKNFLKTPAVVMGSGTKTAERKQADAGMMSKIDESKNSRETVKKLEKGLKAELQKIDLQAENETDRLRALERAREVEVRRRAQE